VLLDRSREPRVHVDHDATTVTLFLTGDDPPEWKVVYDQAWQAAYAGLDEGIKVPGVSAAAGNDIPPWSVIVSLPATMTGEVGVRYLELAREQIYKANAKMTESHYRTPGVGAHDVAKWWNDLPR